MAVSSNSLVAMTAITRKNLLSKPRRSSAKIKSSPSLAPVGTPTAKATVPVVGEAGLPYIGPFTGAGFLRDAAKLPYVYNFRATYGQEMEAQTAYLVDKLKFTKVACFYQNDGFGQAGLSGIKAALEKRGMELVATGTYERNTTAVRKGLLEIRKAEADRGHGWCLCSMRRIR